MKIIPRFRENILPFRCTSAKQHNMISYRISLQKSRHSVTLSIYFRVVEILSSFHLLWLFYYDRLTFIVSKTLVVLLGRLFLVDTLQSPHSQSHHWSFSSHSGYSLFCIALVSEFQSLSTGN